MKGGTRADAVLASIKKSYIWKSITQFYLIQNERVKGKPGAEEFINWINSVGDDEATNHDPVAKNSSRRHQSKNPPLIKIPDKHVLTADGGRMDIHGLIDTVFPTLASDPVAPSMSAILTPLKT